MKTLLKSVGRWAVVLVFQYYFVNCTLRRGYCGYSEVECSDSTRCISLSYVCDGDLDCRDGSDESSCPGRTSICSEFKCSSGRCIANSSRCDGNHDCPGKDYSDEANCTCPPNKFRCNQAIRHVCILKSAVCNAMYDCPDYSDEAIATCKLHGCASTAFQCKDRHCISNRLVCNKQRDCMDGSDEEWEACPCNNTPHHQLCHCQPGYHVHFSHLGLQTCVDSDECAVNTCDHFCENFQGSHECSCDEGYVLKSDNKSCAFQGDPPFLLYRWHSVIMVASLNFTSLRPVNVPANDISGFDVDSNADTIYWSSAKDGKIGKHTLGGDNDEVLSENEILFQDLSSPSLLALDWYSNNIFVVLEDPTAPSIMICYVGPEVHKHGCATLYETVGENIVVTGIATVPYHGYIFWTQMSQRDRNVSDNSSRNGTGTGSIWRANMDGSNKLQIATELINPTGLVVNHVFDRILWIDSGTKTVESINFDGSNRTVVLRLENTELGHVHGLAIVENNISWIEAGNGSSIICKTSGLQQNPSLIGNSSCTNVTKPFLRDAQILKTFHPALQPKGSDPCENNWCDYICTGLSVREDSEISQTSTVLPSPTFRFKCLCPDDFALDESDNGSCLPNNSTAVPPRKSTAKPKTASVSTSTLPTAVATVQIPHAVAVSYKCNISATAIVTLMVTLVALAVVFLVRCLIRRRRMKRSRKSDKILTRSYSELHSDAEGFHGTIPDVEGEYADRHM